MFRLPPRALAFAEMAGLGQAAAREMLVLKTTVFAPRSIASAAAVLVSAGGWCLVPMAKQVRLTLAKAIAKANLRRAEVGKRPITMHSLAVQAGVAATTITRLARSDHKAASALSLDLAGRIVTVLDCGLDDLLEVVEAS